jgi:hypothetical protein
VYPVAQPLAFCLDKALGRELVSTYSGAEMLKLLQIHLDHNVIDKDTAHAMTGALTYKVRTTHNDDNSAALYSATGQERIIENLIPTVSL